MSNRHMAVAETIRQQLGHKALYMIGARDLVATSNGLGGLQFRIGRNAKGVNLITIELDPFDTYSVKFFRTRSGSRKLVASSFDVYVDSLHQTIETHTSMTTAFPRIVSRAS